MKVNIIDLTNNRNDLIRIINEYENIHLNLFNELKQVTVNWQDSKSEEFKIQIEREKNESKLFLEEIKEAKEVITYIIDSYKNLANIISCNLNSRNSIASWLGNCESQINTIINKYNNIDNSFYYEELENINFQKQQLTSLKNQIRIIKNNINNTFTRINNIENAIANKINQLSQIKINEFEYKYEKSITTTKNKSFINTDLLEKNIEKINYYKNQELTLLNNIQTVFNNSLLNYESNNKVKMINNINKNIKGKETFFNKRQIYINEINKVKDNYEITAINVKKDIEGSLK